MITGKGFLCILLAISSLWFAYQVESVFLLIISFSIISFFTIILSEFLLEDFSKKNMSYSYYPLVYQNKPLPITIHLDSNDEFPLQLYPYQTKLMQILKPLSKEIMSKSTVLQTEVSFSEPGRFVLPFSRIKVWDKNFFFYRLITIKNKQSVFVKKNGPPWILDEKKTKLAINQIGKLQSKNGIGDNEFKQLREYVLGDDFRRIEWKSSARANKLIIKETYSESINNLFLILDTGTDMNIGKVDNVFSSAVFASESLMTILSKSKNYLGYCLFDKSVTAFNTNSSNAEVLSAFHKSLASAQNMNASDYYTSFKQISNMIPKRSIIVIVSNFGSKTAEIGNYLRPLLNHRHSIFVFSPFEPLFEQQKFDEDVDELAYTSLTLKYDEELNVVSRNLNRYGVHIIPFGPLDYDEAILYFLRSLEKSEF